jgi:hypothetical protein
VAHRLLKPLTASARAAAPAIVAWDLLVDTTRWAEWGPSVVAVRCAERRVRAGTRGEVRLRLGPWLPFVIERCVPPTFWDWRVGGVPATGHRVTPIDAASCRIAFELSPLVLPYWPVCRVAAGRVARLAEATVATGEPPPTG